MLVERWIMTPKVLEKAREHFGCPTLKGVPLESMISDLKKVLDPSLVYDMVDILDSEESNF